MTPDIHTSAEMEEDAALAAALADEDAELDEDKSPAQWAYERLIVYIQEFEEQLDDEHEVALGLTGGDVGVLQIEGLGYSAPDIVTFYGCDEDGARMQLIQHVSQLNVMLVAMPKAAEDSEARRIGFRLAADLASHKSAAPAPSET